MQATRHVFLYEDIHSRDGTTWNSTTDWQAAAAARRREGALCALFPSAQRRPSECAKVAKLAQDKPFPAGQLTVPLRFGKPALTLTISYPAT